jgi:hypothetical protein
MTTPVESAFRAAEAELDAMVAAAVGMLSGADVEIVDNSDRTYHYKNQSLLWEFRFTATWSLGYEVAKVMVRLSCPEPAIAGEASSVVATTTAEIFQTGKQSRVRRKREMAIAWESLRSRALEAVIFAEIQWGREALTPEELATN